MLPTPAPTVAPSSPKASGQPAVTAEGHPIDYPAPPQNRGSAPFHVLAALFDKLQNERKPEKRRKLLDSWFNHWREEVGPDLYPVLRLILPQKDRERAVYGLKEKNLAKTYIKLIPLGMKDHDAIRLLNWKKPTERDKSSGDFPTVLYEVVSKRSSVIEGSLSVDEVNEILDELSRNMGKHDVQSRILQRVYNKSTPEEQRWIVRVILKDMIISVKETTVFSVFHPDAHDLFNTCSDLKKIAWELWDPRRRLNDADKSIQLFRAFTPMLCKRPTRKIEESVKEMQGRTFIMEEKLDGERMQLHKRGNEYFYCSRKGKDYTYLYGKHVGTGSLTPYVHNAFDPRVDEIILDGEMLVWDPISERNLPFGTLKTAALDKSKTELSPRPCFKVFDLLYLNGMSLLHKSLKFRKKNMKACVKEVKGRLEFTIEFEGKTAKDIRERMDEIMANRGEGLVLKHPDSEYVLDGRNKDWIKVKPEYMDNTGETVDLLVVAGNYGSGRRSGGVSTFICAVVDDRRSSEDDDDELKYSTFVRIGSGFSYADYIWIRQKPWKDLDKKNIPSWLQVSKKSQDDKGDAYLEPEDSFIVKVKAAEIVTSEQYHLGLTMRFPRAVQIREDLTIADCATATAIFEQLRSVKKRKIEEEEGKPKKKVKRDAKPILLQEYRGIKAKNIKVQSDLFEGIRFMVVSDPKSKTGAEDKKDLTKTIIAQGGKVVSVANSDSELLVIYGGSTTPYDVKLIMNKGVCDIIKPQWITDCVKEGELVPLTKKYFFHATDERKESEEYNQEEIEDEGSIPAAGPGTFPEPAVLSIDNVADEETNPAYASWLKVDDTAESPTSTLDDGSETEPDSDNEDVLPDEDELVGDALDDDWLEVDAPDNSAVSDAELLGSRTLETVSSAESVGARMGEDDNAMEYDQDRIFTHLCFYFDSPSNAQKHGMTVKSKNEDDLNRSFEKLSKLIIENGGRLVDLDEPKLTHVVIDKRDTSRRLELMARTSKPKRRHLVIADYVQACLDEDTLLDEDEFVP